MHACTGSVGHHMARLAVCHCVFPTLVYKGRSGNGTPLLTRVLYLGFRVSFSSSILGFHSTILT